jgi:hypothetical protein
MRLKGLVVQVMGGVFLMTGCATWREGGRAIVGPDGTEHQLISCWSISYCYEQARNICGGSYKIANTSTETSSAHDGSVSSKTNLLVKCGK